MNLKELISEVRKAVEEANNALETKSLAEFNKFFKISKDGTETNLEPRTVQMNYPIICDNGDVITKATEIPLLALIPMSRSKLEKATFSMDFQIDDEDGEVKVSFPKKRFGETPHLSHLEITIVPDQLPEGITTIVSGYNSIIQNQLEN